MTVSNKIESLKKLIDKASTVKKEDSNDPDFKVWKNLVERTLIKVFGNESFELNEFRKLKFFYNPMLSYLGEDYSSEHLRCFRRDFEIAKKQITSYIEELEEESQSTVRPIETDKSIINKVFISHSTKDKEYVEELIDILETVGLKSTQIFCSSFDGYGIDLGENFLERIKNELNEEVLVLFVLSENFYSSPVCLCEMGATWIKTSEHIPILIPPFNFENIQGVIPLTQGFKINDSLKLNLFKEKLEKVFDIKPIDFTSWERKRDRIIKRIVIAQ
ncbi:toll/interleukin-1 receptor domain-containing protein [Ancylomarina sp. DW003]|nr:toll/interleukin-1 receptor domain-containing protein [Ancylomarina sp. DW003]MDE5423863.1 toll/interleukin-1 receptor domain-containing protein [Ancylomarina sp. DW003]